MPKDQVAIKVQDIDKSFRLPHERQNSIKSALINFRKKRRGYEEQHVLKNISFEIKSGEFLGIVGRNGSGKSTLLKLLSGIYTPDKGSIVVNGQLTPFIELGVGFNPELSGRENVFLNGALLGFSRKEVALMYDDIVEFAELERFMDQKLKNYSSGMQVRLAFSIAIRANSDILILDEVLAVGDEAFQKKCFDYFEEIKRNKKTVILVTHDMSTTEKYCDRVILINDGRMVLDSTPAKVASAYRQILNVREESRLISSNDKGKSNSEKQVFVKSLKLVGDDGKQRAILKPNEKMIVHCDISSKINVGEVVVTIRCDQPKGTRILFAVSSKRKKTSVKIRAGETVRISWEVENVLNEGKYVLGASVFSKDLKQNYDEALEAYEFNVRGSEWPHSLIWPKDKLYVLEKGGHKNES